MSSRIIFLTLEQILLVHESQIEFYGGEHGLSSLSLLESAILRPQTAIAGKELYPDIFQKTAALVQSLILNHPFLDGNKRTALIAELLFLEINGYILRVKPQKLEEFIINIVCKKWRIEEISSWLEQNCDKNE